MQPKHTAGVVTGRAGVFSFVGVGATPPTLDFMPRHRCLQCLLLLLFVLCYVATLPLDLDFIACLLGWVEFVWPRQ